MVIDGMHRSGTSLAARIVQDLGISLGPPESLLGPGDDNRSGYFEHRAVKAFDDELLGELGGSWDRPPLLLPGWQHDPALDSWRDRARSILDSLPGTEPGPTPPIGIKDPRLSLLLPFWRAIVPIRATLIMIRDPREVVASLAVRRFGVDTDTAASLWLRYQLAATNADPQGLIVRHDEFFDDLANTVDRIASHLELASPSDAQRAASTGHVDLSLRHQRADSSTHTESPMLDLAVHVWNDGKPDFSTIPTEVVTALQQGRLQPQTSQRDAARARADAQSYKVQLKARNDQLRALENRLAELRAAKEAPVTLPAETITAPVSLIVPRDLFVSRVAQDRLAETLGAIASSFEAVVSPLQMLPPGSSVVTHAERQRIANPPLLPLIDQELRGAAAVRNDGIVEARDATVRFIGDPSGFIDPAAPSLDPWLDQTPAHAGEESRPPFAQRPLVLFIGSAPDDDVDDLCRAWVNDLIRRGVEARLAVPEPPQGMYLAPPCVPSEQTLRALVPDVVVALDDGALSNALRWCDPTPIFTQFSHDTVDGVVTGQWVAASATVRAKIGRTATVTDIAETVIRLSSGPYATTAAPDPGASRIFAPPEVSDDERTAPEVAVDRTAAVVAIPLSPTTPRLTVIAELLGEVGYGVTHGMAAFRRAGRYATDLTVVDAGRPSRVLDRIVETRHAAALDTIVWVDAVDVAYDRGAMDGVGALTQTAIRRLEHSTGALAPTPAITRALETQGFAAMTLPLLLPTRLTRRLQDLGCLKPSTAPIIGWILDTGVASPPPSVPAVAEALNELLMNDPELRIEVHAPESWDAGKLSTHPRVIRRSTPPRTDSLARWNFQVWTPATRQVSLYGRTDGLVEASLAGVPTVLDATVARTVGGLADPRLTVRERTDPGAWLDVLSLARDPIELDRRVTRSRALSTTLLGPAARAEVGRRLEGWIATTQDCR